MRMKTIHFDSFDKSPFGTPWLENAELLLKLNLEGLLVKCPKCSSIGLPMKEYKIWKKTRSIFVIHQNGSELLHLCPLSRNHSKKILSQIDMCLNDLEKIIKIHNPYVLFSGGLDSICTLVYTRKIAARLHKTVKAVHVDTSVGIPGAIEYVKEVCKVLKVDLQIVRPDIDFFTLAKKWGIPSHNYRWCCRELKIKPMAEYFKKQPNPKIVIDGIRAAESNLRASYLPFWYHPSFRCLSLSPIFYWSNEEVRTYVGEADVPLWLLDDLKTSPECWCGAYKSRSDFEKLYHLSPELFCKLAALERDNKNGFTFIYENGEKIPLDAIKAEIRGNA